MTKYSIVLQESNFQIKVIYYSVVDITVVLQCLLKVVGPLVVTYEIMTMNYEL